MTMAPPPPAAWPPMGTARVRHIHHPAFQRVCRSHPVIALEAGRLRQARRRTVVLASRQTRCPAQFFVHRLRRRPAQEPRAFEISTVSDPVADRRLGIGPAPTPRAEAPIQALASASLGRPAAIAKRRTRSGVDKSSPSLTRNVTDAAADAPCTQQSDPRDCPRRPDCGDS